MSAVMPPASDLGAMSDVSSRLAFFKNLQGVTTKIHATTNIDEIMLELSQEISALFNADRLTIYVLGDDKTAVRRDVVPGRLVDGLRVIESGLSAGDQVVVSGVQKIFFPGMPLDAKPQEAAPAAVVANAVASSP